MKKHILNSIVAAVFMLPLCFASAQEKGEKGKGKGKGGPPQGRSFQPPKFADIDTDKSGDISREEWVAFQVKAARERAERSFKYLAGEDEKISEDEMKNMMQRRGPGGKGGGPDRGGKGKGRPEGEKGDVKPKRPPVEN